MQRPAATVFFLMLLAAQALAQGSVSPSVAGSWFGTLRFDGRPVHCWISSRAPDGTFMTRYLTKFRESDEYESYSEEGMWRQAGGQLLVRVERKNGTPVEAKEFAYSIDRLTPTEFWYTVVGTKTAFIATRVDAGFALPARCGDSAR